MSIWIGWLVALISAIALALLWQWLRHEIAERIDLERDHAVLEMKLRELQAENDPLMKIDDLAGRDQLMTEQAQPSSHLVAQARQPIDGLPDPLITHRNLAAAYDEVVQTCLAPLDMLVGADGKQRDVDDVGTVLRHIQTTRKRLFDARASLIASKGDREGRKQLGDLDERLGRVERLLKAGGTGLETGDVANEQVDINEAIDGALLIASRQLGNRIRVIRHFTRSPVVAGSIAQIHQMMLHLITNASEAMTSDGVLTVETRRTEMGIIEIDIADSGTGISDEIVGRVFEPFFSSRPTQKTGLGLAIVQRIVKAHQGAIQMRTQPGSGTRFTIRLPIARLPAGNVTSLFRLRDRA